MKLSEDEFAGLLKQNPALKEKVDRQTFSKPKREVKEYLPYCGNQQELLEKDIQRLFFEWALHPDNLILMPELDLIYAIPNGSYKTKYQRYQFQQEGLRSGVPDIHIPVSRKPFFSYYIELKRYKEYRKANHNCSDNQIKWHNRLRAQGHKVDVLWQLAEVIANVKQYLGY